MIKRTYRPPNYETPIKVFNAPFTPNADFFVRYHHANIPEVDVTSWRLRIGGDAINKPIELTYAQLRKDFKPFELAALCLCSGNRRGLFDPHVLGVQWTSGTMGNARWRGVRLKYVLLQAGIKSTALEVSFDGTDSGMFTTTPNFIKSLPLAKAMDENTLLAFEMNDEPLPHWNGFPVRLIVPGWTATYWLKHLTNINVISQPLQNFWMKTACRLPSDLFPRGFFNSQETETTVPITEIVVNSLITNLEDGQTIAYKTPIAIKGVAWDNGNGIEHIDISTDGGIHWNKANLLKDLGRFSWRQWQYDYQPKTKGKLTIMVRATNKTGKSQPMKPIPNLSGYHHNAIQKIAVWLT